MADRRSALLGWAISIACAVVLLWIASHFVELWPAPLVLPVPWFLWAAVAVHLPYAYARAVRLRFALDPLVAQASGDPSGCVPPALLHGSGLVGFLLVQLLPLRLGEFSRPMLLARAQRPGLGFAESVSAVALERTVDGLIVVGLLFAGIGFADVSDGEAMLYVRTSGLVMLAIFALALVVTVILSRAPERVLALVERTPRIGGTLRRVGARVLEPLRALWNPRKGLPFLAWSFAYWGITVFQLWLVARACGLPFGAAEAAAVVAIVGLAIQLPGGPAQAGSFQVGMAVALGLFGPDHEGASSFAAIMYLLQLAGAAVLALPGALLLAWARPVPEDESSRPPPR